MYPSTHLLLLVCSRLIRSEWTKNHFRLEGIAATIINVQIPLNQPGRTEAELHPSSNFQPSTFIWPHATHTSELSNLKNQQVGAA